MDNEQPECPDIHSSTDDYATRFRGAVGQWFLEVQETGTLKLLSEKTSQNILDVGGGHGQNVSCLIHAGHKVTVQGSDSSCKKRIQTYLDDSRIQFVESPLQNLPFPDRSFDTVISYRMITHIPDYAQFIAELCRVAKDSVLVDFASLQSINYFSELFFTLKKGLEKNTRNFSMFHQRDLEKEFNRHGFFLHSRYGQFVFPMALHRMMKIKFISSFLEKTVRILGLSNLFGSPVIMRLDRKA